MKKEGRSLHSCKVTIMQKVVHGCHEHGELLFADTDKLQEYQEA